MIKIDLLKNHLHTIPDLVKTWYDGLGKIWLPDVPLQEVARRFHEHANSDKMPLTYVALHEGQFAGMCSLRENDGILPELTPWLGSLAVKTEYQGQGIARKLIEIVKQEAKKMGFTELYLFAFDATIPRYYESLGWKIIGMNKYKEHSVTVMKSLCA